MRRLQFLQFFVIIATIECWSDKGRENVHKWHMECIQRIGLDAKTVKEALATHHYPNEFGFKSFLLCVGQEIGVVDDEGKVISEGCKKLIADENLDESIALEIIEKCSIVRDTPEETAFSVFLCYQDVAPDEIKVD